MCYYRVNLTYLGSYSEGTIAASHAYRFAVRGSHIAPGRRHHSLYIYVAKPDINYNSVQKTCPFDYHESFINL